MRKLDLRVPWRNPVMFVVYVGAIYVTLLTVIHCTTFNINVAL